MKRVAIVLAIVSMLTILAPALLTLAQPAYTPHENPAAIKSSPDLVALLSVYSDSFSLAALGKYSNAQSVIKELTRANIPDQLKGLANRFNSLAQEIFIRLNNADTALDSASALLAINQLESVKTKLDSAEINIREAESLLKDIGAAAKSLKSALGVLAVPISQPIESAYVRLERSLLRLQELIAELARLQQSLTERQKVKASRLVPTELTLSVSPISAFVGESVTATGALFGSVPLPGRKVTLLLDNEPVSVTTQPDGAFSAQITVPYKYTSQVTLRAVYLPSGDDTATYLAGESQPLKITTKFYLSQLDVVAPKKAHPGFPTAIGGELSSTGEEVERHIKILWDNSLLTEKRVKGKFSFEVTPPPDTRPGKHTLTLLARPQQRYSGATKDLTIEVTILPIQADIQTPSLIVLPGKAQVKGKVSWGMVPIKEAEVRLSFRQSLAQATTTADGSFATFIESTLDLSLAGLQEITISITPTEPWYELLTVKKELFTINPLNLALTLFAFVSLGLIVYPRVRAREKIPREEVVSSLPTPEPSPSSPSPHPGYEFAGIKGRILTAYLGALETVEKVSRATLQPHLTLREFLKTTASKLPTALKPFTELTAITEVALYSIRHLDEETARRAEKLADTIKEELHREPT